MSKSLSKEDTNRTRPSSANGNHEPLPFRPHQQERKALMVPFEELQAHTAKCDDCDRRNSEGMSRCKQCGWQCCRKCQAARGGDKTHETVRGPHIPMSESPEAQSHAVLTEAVSQVATPGRAIAEPPAVERTPSPTAPAVADHSPTAAEQDAIRALVRMSSSPPARPHGKVNVESPVTPSVSRSASIDYDHGHLMEYFSDVDTVGGESTITWQSNMDENDEKLEPILEPLGLCRRNPPRASRPTEMRG